MAKSKKKKSQDFQKVKLKVGKKLKKADNVTNASFKTRSIQVSQQLKSGDSSQPSTKKKQSITELYTQCRHYSASVRLEAVNGLKELISSNPELLSPNLSDILERAAELLIDKDSPVRQAAVRLFKFFLPMVTDKQISPFFPLLCAHLCCAMTHIYDEIQEDSLSVLDLLLETFPRLMITKSSQVLPNFIEQISRRQGQGKAKRSLTTNPNSSTSSVKWRISVLNRLYKFLKAILKYGMFGSSNTAQHSATDISSQLSSTEELIYSTDSQLFVQPCPRRNKLAWTNPGFILGGSGLTKEKNMKGDILDGQFPEYTDTLIPLMLECWVECAPSKQGKHGSGNLISGENVEMMYSILQVTQLLWQCIHSLDLDEDDESIQRSKYLKDFQQHFMSNFPYSVSPVSVKKNKKTSSKVQVSAETLNLTICDIMTYFIGEDNHNGSHDQTWLSMVTQYLNDFIGGVYGHGYIGQSSRTFVKIIERLISSGIQDDIMLGVIVELFNRFQTANIRSVEKTVYLQFFAEKMVSNGDLASISPELRRKFLRSLPELLPLCGKDNHQMAGLLIDTMKKAACQRCSDIIDKSSLTIVGQQWFDPDTGVLSGLSENQQTELISLLYHMPTVDINLVKILVNVARCQTFSNSMVSYLIQVLQGRFEKNWQRADIAATHLGFLTNLILGMTQADIEERVGADIASPCTLLGDIIIVKHDISDDDFEPVFDRHNHIIEIVCSMLRQFPNTEQAVYVILEHLQKVILGDNIVPLQVAFGICKFAESLSSIPSEFESLINRLNISLVSHLVTCYDSANQTTVKKMKDICCNSMLKSSTGFETLLETACLHSGQASDVEKLDVLLKTVMLFLTEGRHTNIQGHSERLRLMSSLQLNLQQSVEVNKHLMTSELETMVVNFNYMLSSIR